MAAGETRGVIGASGARLSYVTVDSPPARTAEAILLIHGTGMSARTWTHQLQGLAPTTRVYALDLPGHGNSDATATATVEGYAEAAAQMLDALSLRKVFVAGHSLGGGVALALAARRPELVKGLLLVSSCARLPHNYSAFDGAFRVLPGPLRRLVLFASAKRVLFPAGAAAGAVRLGLDDLRACPPETVRRDTAAAKAMDLEATARALRMPVLILCGTRDVLTPVALSQRLHELIPGSQLVLVQGAGHMLPLESPERVNQEIAAFVQRVKAGASILPTQLVGDIARGLRGGWLAKLRALLFSRGA